MRPKTCWESEGPQPSHEVAGDVHDDVDRPAATGDDPQLALCVEFDIAPLARSTVPGDQLIVEADSAAAWTTPSRV